METLETMLALLIGIVLRLLLPIGVTAIVVYLLRRLDARWQAEAMEQSQPVVKPECWKVKGCSAERRAGCPAAGSELPCWQVFRKPNGYLREECLTCDVLRQAPIPIGS